jgi:prephenate dehydratase
MDLLAASGLSIVGERSLSIRHCLMAPKGSSLDQIHSVFSHEQGLAQCSQFLEKHRSWEVHPRLNTAEAAQFVAQENNLGYGAIASARAAELYDLDILARNIQNHDGNTTRFIILARKPLETGSKTSIYFVIRNVAGSLQSALEALSTHGVSLIALHTRPIPQQIWSYSFFADLAGGVDQPHVSKALEEMRAMCQQLTILGCYQPDMLEEEHD